MSPGAWIAWGIALLVAIAALIVAILAWRKPKAPAPLPRQPPDLRLERVGNIGSGIGPPRESIKARLRLVNDGEGEATGWQVVVVNEHDSEGVNIGRESRRGPRQMASEISWHEDASTGGIPPGQHRDLDDWLYVEAPPGTPRLGFLYTIHADGMTPKKAMMDVRFGADSDGVGVEFFV